MRDFKQIKAWHKGHELTLYIYEITKSFPREELFGITSQMRRAAYSIPSNIAEGCGRDSEAELARFMIISMGSASEIEYFALLAKDLTYISPAQFQDLDARIKEVKRMLAPFIKRLKAD